MFSLKLKKIVFVNILLLLIFVSSVSAQPVKLDVDFYTPPTDLKPYPLIESGRVKNIIFLIGDGMGLAQLQAARIRAVGAVGKLYIEKLPVTGIKRTHSVNSLITDSAASGTALATGVKTNNGMICVTPEGKKAKTILEFAREKGMATGLVATSTITHATPASFAAHVPKRSDEATIATHIIENRVNVIFGGGRKFFVPQTFEGSGRKDSKNLIEEAKEYGYKYVETKSEMVSADGEYILGLFQMEPMTTFNPEPMIYEMTSKAIEILSRDKDGFFLMVEGSQIDWGCHKNDPDNTIRQTLLFDLAVKKAMDFALKDKETLVIVTADHETGGIAINGGILSGRVLVLGWTTKGHTGVPVPIYAFGPHAQRFTGVMDNTDVPKIMAELLNISPFPEVLE